jgi:hypothetical protein
MKQKLVENFSKDWNEPLHIRKLNLNESVKIVEANGKKYNVRDGFEVPVWRLDKKNLNNRVYSRRLGEKVAKEYKDLVTVNLADHPEGDSDGSVKDILAVSKNPHIREGVLYVDTYPVDESFANKLERIVELGGGLGVSSSCYGDVDGNGNVLEEDFEVTRWHDFVLSPSYEVFVTQESFKENINENLTINKEPIKESKNMPENKVSALLEKTTRLNILKLVEDADKIEKISDRLSSLEEAKTYVSNDFLPDLHQSISEKIESLKKESLELAEKGKLNEKLNEEIQLKESEKIPLQEQITSLQEEKKSLEEKLEKANTLISELKEHSQKAEQLLEVSDAEAGSKFSAKEYLELAEKLSETEEKITNLEEEFCSNKKENEDLEKENSELKEKVSRLISKIKTLREKNSSLEEALNDYSKEVEDGLMNENGDENIYNQDEFDYESFIEPEISNIENDLELDIQQDEVEDYYNDLIDEEPRYESFKSVIMSCKTLIEAQRTALRLRTALDKMPSYNKRKVKESVSIKEEADVGRVMKKGWL